MNFRRWNVRYRELHFNHNVFQLSLCFLSLSVRDRNPDERWRLRMICMNHACLISTFVRAIARSCLITLFDTNVNGEFIEMM